MLLYTTNKGKLLFVEIPRTGTTTIQNIIINYEYIDEKRHISIKDYIDKHPEHINYLKSAFVRNPYDRFASLYEHTKHFNQKKDEVKTFESFVNWYVDNSPVELTFDNIRQTQSDMLNINNIKIDWIGKFENFENDIITFINYFEFSNTLPIVNLNKFKHLDYKNYYNTKTKNIIEKYFEIDLDNFKYIY